MKSILFVCTGNTCRSPLAEGLFRQMVEKEGLDIEVRSAGVAAYNGSPISQHSANILREKGIQLNKTSTWLSKDSIDESDLILTMTMNHKQAILQKYPHVVDKVYAIKEYVDEDPRNIIVMAEWDRLISALQLKQTLGESITDEEQTKLKQLESSIPSYDVTDPFGGSYDTYQQCAEELEQLLSQLLNIVKSKENDSSLQ